MFKKGKKLLFLGLILSIILPVSVLATDINGTSDVQITLSPFPNGMDLNFNSIEFNGILGQSEHAQPAFKNGQTSVANPTFKVISNDKYTVYISAEKFKTSQSLTGLTDPSLSAERLKVKVGDNGEYTNVPEGTLQRKTIANSENKTSLDGETRKVHFQMDLSEGGYDDGFVNIAKAIENDTSFTTEVTFSLSPGLLSPLGN